MSFDVAVAIWSFEESPLTPLCNNYFSSAQLRSNQASAAPKQKSRHSPFPIPNSPMPANVPIMINLHSAILVWHAVTPHWKSATVPTCQWERDDRTCEISAHEGSISTIPLVITTNLTVSMAFSPFIQICRSFDIFGLCFLFVPLSFLSKSSTSGQECPLPSNLRLVPPAAHHP